jgi:uncharacterized integral membrane protein
MLRWLGLLLVAVAAALFAVENSERIHVQWLFWAAPRVPVAVALLAAFLLGAVATALIGWPAWWREHRARRAAERLPTPGNAPAVSHQAPVVISDPPAPPTPGMPGDNAASPPAPGGRQSPPA